MIMSGKKVVGIFIVIATICSIGMGLWIKQAYDTRPKIDMELTK